MPRAGLLLIAAVVASQRASAAERWLSLEPSQHCAVERDVLASRIDAALAGQRDPELVVHVELDDAARGTTARVRLARGTRELGSKRLEASRCDEALEAVVAITALALGTPAQLGTRSTPSVERGVVAARPALEAEEREIPAPAARARPRPSPREQISDGVDRGASDGDPSALVDGWSWLWHAGVGRGKLAATAVVGSGIGIELGRSELRGSLEYGLPSSDELADSGIGLQRSESDFAAANLNSCHALDAGGWLSVCAGVEARVTRWSRVETRPGQERVRRTGLDPAALAGGGVSIAYGAASWRPRLDVSAQLPMAGNPWQDGAIGIRAAVGAQLPF